MKWSKILIAGVAGGIVAWLADFVMHGVIMGEAYTKYEAFTQEAANPFLFLLVSVFVALTAAILFAKTRSSWSPGWQGGATFGFFLGLTAFFPQFYMSLVIEGFPYHMSWCWGGMNVIGGVILGTILGSIYK